MTLRVITTEWKTEFTEGIKSYPTELRIISPFITHKAINLFPEADPNSIRVITRYNLADFANNVSSIKALYSLLDIGASIRGIQGLHAKMYMFGERRAIITSANFTQTGFTLNHELGIVTEEEEAIKNCLDYFDYLWRIDGIDLKREQLDDWYHQVKEHKKLVGPTNQTDLGDFGARVLDEGKQAFVKFLGSSDNRHPVSYPILDQLIESGCHKVLAYPKKKKPSSVKDNDTMFISRLTDEKDIRIYGRAIGKAHDPDRDVATKEDIDTRDWMEKWPNFIRITNPEFVNGTIGNGVSLNELMNSLSHNSFESTKKNAAKKIGNNTNPRRAYSQQAAVRLSLEGHAWLNKRLDEAFQKHGKFPQDELKKID